MVFYQLIGAGYHIFSTLEYWFGRGQNKQKMDSRSEFDPQYESGRLRWLNSQYVDISFGSKTSLDVGVPVISGYSPEVQLRVPSHSVIGNRNILTKLREDKGNRSSGFYIQCDKKNLTDPLDRLGGFKQALPISIAWQVTAPLQRSQYLEYSTANCMQPLCYGRCTIQRCLLVTK